MFPLVVLTQSQKEDALGTLAKQLAATGAPSAAHSLVLLSHQTEEGETAALAAFVVGYWALQKDDSQEAVKAFSNPQSEHVGIADYAALYLARTQRHLKLDREAMQTLENFSSRFPSSNLKAEALQDHCQILIDQGEAGACAELLRNQPDYNFSPRYLLLAARALEAALQWAEEAKLLERVAYEFPLSSEAPQAQDALQELRRSHPSSVHPPSPEIVWARANVYFGQKRYKDALADFQSAASSHTLVDGEAVAFQPARLSLRVGECQYHLGRFREAVASFRKAEPLDGELKAEKLFYIAELKRKPPKSSVAESQGIVSQLEEQFSTSPWAEAAIFSLGNYFLVHQDRAQATAQFEKVLKQFPQGKNAAEALFRVAWGAYLRRDYHTAQTHFLNFVKLYPASSRTVAAIYWLGRMEESSDARKAAAYYSAVVHDFGESYYAQSASQRLSRVGSNAAGAPHSLDLPELKPKFVLQDEPFSDVGVIDSLKRARLFRRISLSDLEARELRAVLDRTRSVEATTELARLYTADQNYGAAMVTVRQTLPDYFRASLDQLPIDFWRELFPRPYWSVIQREAKNKTVDSYLVLALIRQESAFNPSAKSRANALGLMQLLPREGRRYARKERIPRWRLHKIYDPEVNIRLGVACLADTLRRYNGSMEMTLAAYNAGDDRVSTWLEEQRLAGTAEDPMEFVESIPFTETREYVQILLRNLSYYRKIYSHGGA
jgi:soluble lytic murein transglycosylase